MSFIDSYEPSCVSIIFVTDDGIKEWLISEAMLFILKAIQTVNSGLLRFRLQMKWDPFSN